MWNQAHLREFSRFFIPEEKEGGEWGEFGAHIYKTFQELRTLEQIHSSVC